MDGDTPVILATANRGASATCAASNGGQEVVNLTIPFRHTRSSERIIATIEPAAGVRIVETGVYEARLTFDNAGWGPYQIDLNVDFEHRPGRNTRRIVGRELN